MTSPDEHPKSSGSHVLVGETYEVMSWIKGDPEDGRRAVVVKGSGESWRTVRWANGLEAQVAVDRLRGPVEALRPGIDEPCRICNGSHRIKIFESESDGKPWSLIEIGEKDCPNCKEAG